LSVLVSPAAHRKVPGRIQGERNETMRHTIIAPAVAASAVMMLLAGCSSDMNGRSGAGMSGSSTPSSSTSGAGAAREGGLDSRTISPEEQGMGQSPTRDSLTNPNRAGSGSSSVSPYPRTSRNQTQTISPDQPGMGESQTRRSLPNSTGSQ